MQGKIGGVGWGEGRAEFPKLGQGKGNILCPVKPFSLPEAITELRKTR